MSHMLVTIVHILYMYYHYQILPIIVTIVYPSSTSKHALGVLSTDPS